MNRQTQLTLLATGIMVQLACGGGDGPTTPTPGAVSGKWNLLYVKEISRADASVFVTVCCTGTSVESYGSGGAWSSVYDDGVNLPDTVTGHVDIRGDSMIFTFTDPLIPEYDASFQVSQGTMIQLHDGTYDFDGDGTDEPAIEELRYTSVASPPPQPQLTFPALNPGVNSQYCIRGNTTIYANSMGTVDAADCDYNVVFTGQGYLEVWRVRVATAMTVTFTVDAPGFDAFMDVGQATISGGDITNFVVLDSDDDTLDDDPVVTLQLQPNTDYAVVVSGFDYPEVGRYTLHIN